jgi:hypothetical protein
MEKPQRIQFRHVWFWPLACFIFLSLTVISCGGGGGDGDGGGDNPAQPLPDVVNVSITPANSDLVSGEFVRLTATVTGSNDTSVTWTSSGGIFLPKKNTATFVAPNEMGRYDIVATSVANNQVSATASVNVEPNTPEQQLIFITDQSVMVSSIGDQVRFEVQLIGTDGSVVEDGEVSWTSADPSVATVTQDGSRAALITAQTQSTTFTTVTAHIGEVEASATILVTNPSEGTILISSTVVKNRTESAVTLERNSLTETLAPGQRLVSGNHAGVLVRILSVERTDDEVLLTTEFTSLVDAFDDLSVRATSAPVKITALFVGSNKAIVTTKSRGLISPQVLLDDVTCRDKNGSTVDLDLGGANILQSSELWAEAGIDISFENGLDLFYIKTGGSFEVNATAGRIKNTSPVSGVVECSVELSSIPMVIIPAAVFMFTPSLTPILGVEIETLFAESSFDLSGPQGTVSASVEAGIEYNYIDGWVPIAESSFNGDFEPFSSSFLSNQSFGSNIAPFAQLDVGLVVDIGFLFFKFNLVDVRFAELKGYGLLDFELPAPLDDRNVDYVGPSWSVGLGISGALKAELRGTLGNLLSLVGVPTDFGEIGFINERINTAESLFLTSAASPAEIDGAAETTWTLAIETDGDYKAFDKKLNSTESLSLTSTASPAEVEVEQGVAFRAVTNGNESGSIEFLGSKDGSSVLELLTSTEMIDGVAETTWTPVIGTEGDYEIVAHLFSDFPSDTKPYSSDSIALVTVNAKPEVPPVEEPSLPQGTGPLGDEGPWVGSMAYGLSGIGCRDTGYFLKISFTENPDGSLTGSYLGKHFNNPVTDPIYPVVGESGTLTGQRTGAGITFSLSGDITGQFFGSHSVSGQVYRIGGGFANASVCTDEDGDAISSGIFVLIGTLEGLSQ